LQSEGAEVQWLYPLAPVTHRFIALYTVQILSKQLLF